MAHVREETEFHLVYLMLLSHDRLLLLLLHFFLLDTKDKPHDSIRKQ